MFSICGAFQGRIYYYDNLIKELADFNSTRENFKNVPKTSRDEHIFKTARDVTSEVFDFNFEPYPTYMQPIFDILVVVGIIGSGKYIR